jgi:trigger factor
VLTEPVTLNNNTLNITLDKPTATDGLIKIKLTETDYQPKVEEKVREYARKANIKGFRAGKVPAGVVKKMFGRSILVEEVNHLLSHSVSDFIKEQKLNVLGDPLPNHEKARLIDWDTQKDFEFEFQIGLVDDFTYDLSKKIKIDYHPIQIDNKVLEETLADITERYGKVSYPEASSATDHLIGEISKPGEEPKHVFLRLEKVAKKQQARFTGLAKDATVDFDIDQLFADVADKAHFLGLTADEAKKVTGTYTFKVNTISRVEPAAINTELFDKVFGKDTVKTEEEFIEKVKATIGENYKREADAMLDRDILQHFVDKTKIAMPDAFLQSWLKSTSNGEITEEVLAKEFEAYRQSLKWDLIKSKIATEHQLEVQGDEVRERAKQMIVQQFGGPAIAEQLGDKLDAIANNYLAGQDGKGENFMKLYNQLKTDKIMKFIREQITINEKPVSLAEFKKLAGKGTE